MSTVHLDNRPHGARFANFREDQPHRPTSALQSGGLRISLLGCGTVGSAIARRLLDADSDIHTRGINLHLQSILVRAHRSRRHIPRDLFTTSFDDILRSRPDVVVEVVGGIEPARRYIARALEAGISVVTANKSVIARHGRELQAIGFETGAQLAYEAAVCAAIPVLGTLRQLRAERVTSIIGIVNGTTNFMLTRIGETNCTRAEALAEAQRLGYAEPDPTADLTGRDSAEKLTILAREAGCTAVELDDVPVTGIDSITDGDILAVRRRGFAVKLVAEFHRVGARVSLRVGPALVPRTHRLAHVSLARNGLSIGTLFSGELFLEGEGAGPDPTAGAVLADVLRLARGHSEGHPAPDESKLLRPPGSSVHYVRLPGGASRQPSRVMRTFRKAGIHLQSLELREGVIRAYTLESQTHVIRQACDDMDVDSRSVLIIPTVGMARAQSLAGQPARQPLVEIDLPRMTA